MSMTIKGATVALLGAMFPEADAHVTTRRRHLWLKAATADYAARAEVVRKEVERMTIEHEAYRREFAPINCCDVCNKPSELVCCCVSGIETWACTQCATLNQRTNDHVYTRTD